MATLLSAAPATAAGRPVLEVGDIFRQYGPAYRARHPLPLHPLRVMEAIETCRTAALGGHLEQCDHCGHQRPVYNSCRNRHCPKCQATVRVQWLADRQAELLPVGYFHNVFTLPHELNDLLAANPRVMYNLLFHSAAQTLQAFAADPAYGLGGQLGFTAVLHTWDQKLLYHVHLHCVIAGGALACDPSRWLPARPNYLFPVRELSDAFRARYLDGLQRAFARGALPRPPGGAGRGGGAGGVVAAARREGLGGVFAAAVGRPRESPGVPEPVHASHRHQQPPPAQPGGRAGDVRLPRPARPQPGQTTHRVG